MNRASRLPCDHVIAQLWEYLDGTVGDADRAALDRAYADAMVSLARANPAVGKPKVQRRWVGQVQRK